MIEFNPNSNHHMSCIFFSGTLAFEEVVADGFYKNGNPKTKKVKKLKPIRGLGIKPHISWKTSKPGVFSVKEEVLAVLANSKVGSEIAKVMLEIRGLEKELSTYYDSVEELIYPDGCVHAQFNHTATNTGRLSCSKPNIQNSPSGDSKVPQHFVSRFQNGNICSADYSGLEVRIEAQLSNDEQYIKNIVDGVDFHVLNLALKEGRSYEEVNALYTSGDVGTKRKRSQIKGFTFAQQYGAGNKKIAFTTGFTVEEVQGIKDARRSAYPRLHMYYDWLKAEVERNGQYKDPWGRIYKFKKYPNKFPWQPGTESYSPTEVLNYRTQGFATGTIVTSMVGLFWRTKAIYARDMYLMVNTIHDSLMLDVREKYLENAKRDLTVLKECGKLSQRLFDYKINVPIDVEISHGPSWFDLK